MRNGELGQIGLLMAICCLLVLERLTTLFQLHSVVKGWIRNMSGCQLRGLL
jgi:hypothetical protein